MLDDLSLARQLSALRERSGLTLRDLQKATFVSDSALSRYLSGQTVPPWTTVVRICERLGAEAAALRPAWETARARRRESRVTPPPAGDPHAALGRSLSTISDDVASAIALLQSSSAGHVTELLKRVQRLSEEAAAQLRTLPALREHHPGR